MNTPSVISFDLSMTATGLCDSDGNTSTIKSKLAGDQRLVAIADSVHRLVGAGAGYLGANLADFAVIEDLPTHAKSAGITGMVQGAVRVELMRLGVPYVLVTPASLKKWTTGKGNADKVAMAVSALKRFGRDFPNDNECDAWCLRAMALDALGCPLAPMPAVNRAALDAVKWPQISGALGVLSDAKGLYSYAGGTVGACVAETVVRIYNSHRRAGALPAWRQDRGSD